MTIFMLNYAISNQHTYFHFWKSYFSNKTYKPNFNLTRHLANQFLKFHTNRELTSVGLTAKKIDLSANFFCGQFHARCYARKVVLLGLRNFPLKQTKVTLVSWRFYAQCRQAFRCICPKPRDIAPPKIETHKFMNRLIICPNFKFLALVVLEYLLP